MKIRKAQIKDLKEIDEIYQKGILDEEKNKSPRKSKKEIITDLNNSKKDRLSGFKKAIYSSKGRFLICEESKKIISFGNAALSDKKRGAEITLIYVRKEYREKGVGSKILNELLKWLKEKGENKIHVTMDLINDASMNLHKKAGFKKVVIMMQKKF